MRNIKRILAMSLATVMLCASMVVGSAASFNDADKIVNTEAVTVTTGLGIFAGATDGNFNPTGTTTRAQMAAVIVKMLYGSDINADQFKGASKFSDVADFEGGWAEGYINLCSNLGVIAGYPDGTFKPAAAVTTAEATTMIINALKVDAGTGIWPMTVMAKAEEMKLFAELAIKPGTNEALTRDDLASVVFEAIKYSPSEKTGYRIPNSTIVFDDFITAYFANSQSVEGITEVVGEDTIANTVFEMTSASGIITANQATGAECTIVGDVELNIETGLDAIGHYVTAYFAEEYKSEIDPGVAYAIVDEADYVYVDERGVDTKKEYREYFGNKNYNTTTGILVDGAYEVSVGSFADKYINGETISIATGTYMIYEGNLIGYFAEPVTSIGRVSKVGKDTIRINAKDYSNSEDEDIIVEYDGVAKNDIVVITTAQDMTYIAKANCVIGEITRTSTNEYNETVITVGGKNYTSYTGDVNVDGLGTIVDFNKSFEIYTYGDKFIGWKNVGSTADVSDVVFVIDVYAVDTLDSYGNTVTKTYAQGIDVNGKEISYLIDIDGIEGLEVSSDVVANDFYVFDKATDRDAKKHNIMVGAPIADVYNEDNGDTFYADTTGAQALKRDEFVMIVGGETYFITDATKFIVFEGTKSNLEIAIITGAITREFDDAYAVFSKDNNGNNFVEIVVINDTVNVAGEDLIYVFDTNGATTADGIEMDVYFTESNSVKSITVDTAYDAGFYSYTYDAVENIYDLTAAAPDYEDQTFVSAYNGFVVASGVNGLKATDVKIFDARDEDVIKDSDISRIESLDDMVDATNADYVVIFDAIVDDDDNIVNIIVKSVAEENE